MPGPGGGGGQKTAKWKGNVEWTAGRVQVQGELTSFTARRQDSESIVPKVEFKELKSLILK